MIAYGPRTKNIREGSVALSDAGFSFKMSNLLDSSAIDFCYDQINSWTYCERVIHVLLKDATQIWSTKNVFIALSERSDHIIIKHLQMPPRCKIFNKLTL